MYTIIIWEDTLIYSSVLYFEVSFMGQKLKNVNYHCTFRFCLVMEFHMKRKHLWCSTKVKFWCLIVAV